MSEPKTYRKKPVHVKAMQWDGTVEGATPIINWILEKGGTATYTCSNPARCAEHNGDAPHWIAVETLEGTVYASLKDFIIRGVAGEFYPVKPKIFAATYEEVDQDGNRVNSTQYPSSDRTPVLTVPAIIEWLEGEKEDVEANQKKMGPELSKLLGKYADRIHNQLTGSIMMIETLIEKLTKSTFEQMDEAQHDQ